MLTFDGASIIAKSVMISLISVFKCSFLHSSTCWFTVSLTCTSMGLWRWIIIHGRFEETVRVYKPTNDLSLQLSWLVKKINNVGLISNKFTTRTILVAATKDTGHGMTSATNKQGVLLGNAYLRYSRICSTFLCINGCQPKC